MAMRKEHPYCDGSGPHHENEEARVLPIPGNGNLILCRFCHSREIRWRLDRNRELSKAAQFDTPNWWSLKRYDSE